MNDTGTVIEDPACHLSRKCKCVNMTSTVQITLEFATPALYNSSIDIQGQVAYTPCSIQTSHILINYNS